jgi:hypothetical protein
MKSLPKGASEHVVDNGRFSLMRYADHICVAQDFWVECCRLTPLPSTAGIINIVITDPDQA